MYARVTTFTLDPSRLDAVRESLEQSSGELESVEGFRGLRLLTSDSGGKSFAVTYWDTAEQMKGSTAAIAPMRDRMLAAGGGGDGAASVDQCEVVYDSLVRAKV